MSLSPFTHRTASCFVAVGAAAVIGACSSSGTSPALSKTCTPVSPVSGGHPSGLIDSVYPLAGRPFGVAIAASGAVLIGRQDENDVVRGSISDFRFTTSIPVGLDPGTMAMAPDGLSAAVSNYNEATVGLINVTSNVQVAAVNVSSSPFQVRFHPDGSRLYVGTLADGIKVFDVGTGEPLPGMRAGAQLNGMAFTSTGCTLYVSSHANGVVVEFNTATDSVLRFMIVGPAPQEIAISPDSSELWVADEALGVQVYGLAAGELRATIPGTAGAWGLALTPDGQQLYATLSGQGLIAIIDRAGKTVVATLGAGVPRRVAFDATGAHAVVADEALGAILIK